MLHSIAKIKIEDDDETTDQFFQSKNKNEDPKNSKKIDETDLVPLSSKHAAKVKYPPGCPVYYDLKKSLNGLVASYGVVKSVYFDFESRACVYKVERTNFSKSLDCVCKDSSEVKSSACHFLWQEQLSYAMNCAVRVKGMIKNEPNKELKGRVVCHETGNGDKTSSYSVQFCWGGNCVRVEMGVNSDRITFRKTIEQESLAQMEEDPIKPETNKQPIKSVAEKPHHTMDPAQKTADNKIDNVNQLDEEIHLRKGANKYLDLHDLFNDSNNNSESLQNRHSSKQIEQCKHAQDTSTTPQNSSTNTKPSMNDQTRLSSKHLSEGNALGSPNHQNSAFATAKQNGNKKQLQEQSNGASSTKTPDQPCPNIEPLGKKSLPTIPTVSRKMCSGKSEPSPRLENPLHYQVPKINGAYHRITIPIWVTETRRKSLFFHIIGSKYDGGEGHKTRKIQQETACAVIISEEHVKPINVTINPLEGATHHNMVRAKEMLEGILLDFLECDGAKARLLYELSVTFDGALNLRAEGGVVQQRNHRTNKIVWMKLIYLPTFKTLDETISLENNLHHSVQQVKGCSVEVFSQDLNNMTLPLKLCKPFALVFGKCTGGSGPVGRATLGLEEAIKKYLQSLQAVKALDSLGKGKKAPNESNPDALSKALVSSRKRQIQPDSGRGPPRFIVGSSTERPNKVAKVTGTNNVRNSNEASCVLHVPSWVQNHCTADISLFHHILGIQNGDHGYKTKMITTKTKCAVELLNYWNGDSLTISIRSTKDSPSFWDVNRAKRMIVESLMEFIKDRNSERRLLYELAMNAEGTYDFRRAEGVVQQECHITHRSIWMKLLELPFAESKGKLVPHGQFLLNRILRQELTHGTGCVLDVYGCEDSTPTLSGPYVLVHGNLQFDVTRVAARVASKIEEHQQGCYCSLFTNK